MKQTKCDEKGLNKCSETDLKEVHYSPKMLKKIQHDVVN